MAYEGHIGFRMFGFTGAAEEVVHNCLLVVGPVVELIIGEERTSIFLKDALEIATDDDFRYVPWYDLPLSNEFN